MKGNKMLNWIGWMVLRVAVTLACVHTMTVVIAAEGYRVEYSTMLLGAAFLVILIGLWSPRCEKCNHGG